MSVSIHAPAPGSDVFGTVRYVALQVSIRAPCFDRSRAGSNFVYRSRFALSPSTCRFDSRSRGERHYSEAELLLIRFQPALPQGKQLREPNLPADFDVSIRVPAGERVNRL